MSEPKKLTDVILQKCEVEQILQWILERWLWLSTSYECFKTELLQRTIYTKLDAQYCIIKMHSILSLITFACQRQFEVLPNWKKN